MSENDEPCMCGTPFTCLADEHDREVAMTAHPSNPDQLMARALGVCWHSPTSDRWPCTDRCSYCNAPGGSGRSCPNCTPDEEDGEPLADWEKELAHKEFRNARQVCGCDQDPIECNHEAALGQAEEKLRKVQRLLAFYNSNDPEFRERHEKYFLRALGETEIRPEWSWTR